MSVEFENLIKGKSYYFVLSKEHPGIPIDFIARVKDISSDPADSSIQLEEFRNDMGNDIRTAQGEPIAGFTFYKQNIKSIAEFNDDDKNDPEVLDGGKKHKKSRKSKRSRKSRKSKRSRKSKKSRKK
jgi:hypothetical protein